MRKTLLVWWMMHVSNFLEKLRCSECECLTKSFSRKLRGLNTADSEVSANRNVILIFSPSAELEVRTYRDATEALPALFILEREFVDRDVVLVKADTSDDVRIAFRNYFSDAQDFIGMVDDACKQLS